MINQSIRTHLSGRLESLHGSSNRALARLVLRRRDDLAKNRALISHIKQATYDWMQTYWQPKERAQQFVVIYQQVIADPKAQFPLRYDPQSTSDLWFAIDQYDVAWKARHKFWPTQNTGMIYNLKLKVYRVFKKLGLK